MDSPNAMQNSRTGMLASSAPVGVVPNAPRWPSWKIHTSAPNAAVSESTLRIRAFTGRTTLPVSMNSSRNVMTAMMASTSGRREVMASTLSRLIWAMPVNATGRSPGVAIVVQSIQLLVRRRREQRCTAADRQEGAAVADRGGSDRRADLLACRRRHLWAH